MSELRVEILRMRGADLGAENPVHKSHPAPEFLDFRVSSGEVTT
ncbi:MAG: hypothetical protein ACP5JG_15045 [Anaerolineae bacterium]